jgi:hypothetical protein
MLRLQMLSSNNVETMLVQRNHGENPFGGKPTVELPTRLSLDLTTFEYVFNLVKRLPSSNFKLGKSTTKARATIQPIDRFKLQVLVSTKILFVGRRVAGLNRIKQNRKSRIIIQKMPGASGLCLNVHSGQDKNKRGASLVCLSERF